MKKTIFAAAIVTAASQASAVTFSIGYAGLDVPFEPPFADPGHLELTTYSSHSYTPAGPISTFSVILGNSTPNPGDFSYSADWTYYGASGFLVSNNVSCVSLDTADFCNSGILSLTTNGAFQAVIAIDTATQTPLYGPTSSNFDLRWQTTTGSGVYDWRIILADANCEESCFTNAPLYSFEVPVPSAVWLFGSALIGLVGVKRNK